MEIKEMATAKNKSPTKRAAARPKKAASRKKAVMKKSTTNKSPAKKATKGNFFREALKNPSSLAYFAEPDPEIE